MSDGVWFVTQFPIFPIVSILCPSVIHPLEMIAQIQSHNNIPYIPPELIDRIIDHLHDSPSDLRSCALAAKVFLATSRFHIFYSVSIYGFLRGRRACSNLVSAIQHSPQIARCIHKFRLAADGEESFQTSDLNSQFQRNLLTLLNSFTVLQHLTIINLAWTEVPSEIRKAFRTVLALPSLIIIDIWGLRFARLRHFTNLLRSPLKRLSVDARWNHPADEEIVSAIDEEDKIVRETDRQPCYPEYLSCAADDFVDWLLGPQSIVNISNTRRLHGSCQFNQEEHRMVRLLKCLGSSLEHLLLFIVCWGMLLLSLFIQTHP